MATDDSLRELREDGVALLRDVFAKDALTRLKEAAGRCFKAIAADGAVQECYGFNRSSHSVRLTALMDFGCEGGEELLAPLSVPGIEELVSETMGSEWTCNMEHSWVRKKFAPLLAPSCGYHLQNWHQDGALGVRFPLGAGLESGPECGTVLPMTELLTCWVPLNACGVDSPGLEFVRRRQPALVHFSELDDSFLRQRFLPEEFWAPALEVGDGLVFMKDLLHRTYTRDEMRHNRMSVEYRIFKAMVSPQSATP